MDTYDLNICLYVPEESPCSPITHPWQEDGAMPNLSDIKNLNLDESKLVPDPKTLFCGNPESFHVT